MSHILIEFKHNKGMKRKRLEYILVLIFFIIALFSSSLNMFLIDINPNLSKEVIEGNYENREIKEYRELLKTYDLPNNNLNLTLSKIKYRNIYNFKEEITIFKGFKDGVKVGYPVLTNDGLVGVISKTYEHSSVVELVTNKLSEISVKVNDSYGILKYQDGLIVSDLSNYDNIKEDDKIYTSGLGNLPGNIYIGTVKDIVLNNTKIEKKLSVFLGANLDNINYVYIYGEKNV